MIRGLIAFGLFAFTAAFFPAVAPVFFAYLVYVYYTS